jgi:hypothetical protein
VADSLISALHPWGYPVPMTPWPVGRSAIKIVIHPERCNSNPLLFHLFG